MENHEENLAMWNQYTRGQRDSIRTTTLQNLARNLIHEVYCCLDVEWPKRVRLDKAVRLLEQQLVEEDLDTARNQFGETLLEVKLKGNLARRKALVEEKSGIEHEINQLLFSIKTKDHEDDAMLAYRKMRDLRSREKEIVHLVEELGRESRKMLPHSS